MSYFVRQMGHVSLQSPKPDALVEDLVEIVGLKVTERSDTTIYLSCNDRHHEISIVRGETAGVRSVGFEAMDNRAVDEVRRRVASKGLAIVSDHPSSERMDHAFTFKLPNGAVFEVHTPIVRDQPKSNLGPGARPRRIEHVNLQVPDPEVTHDIIKDVLGLKLSDETDNKLFRWYRSNDGYHHTIAISPGECRLHHYAFDMHSLQDLGRIADILVAKDRALLWGPGRHGAGGNVFTYFADANGCVVETSVEMDRIENDDLYSARSWDMSQGISGRWVNLWGTPPSQEWFVPGLNFI